MTSCFLLFKPLYNIMTGFFRNINMQIPDNQSMIFHLEICSMSSYRKDVLVSKCKYISINLESLPSSGELERKLLWTSLPAEWGTTMLSLQLRYFGCGPLIKIKLHHRAIIFTPSLTLTAGTLARNRHKINPIPTMTRLSSIGSPKIESDLMLIGDITQYGHHWKGQL